jgi:hypothetical protein
MDKPISQGRDNMEQQTTTEQQALDSLKLLCEDLIRAIDKYSEIGVDMEEAIDVLNSELADYRKRFNR